MIFFTYSIMVTSFDQHLCDWVMFQSIRSLYSRCQREFLPLFITSMGIKSPAREPQDMTLISCSSFASCTTVYLLSTLHVYSLSICCLPCVSICCLLSMLQCVILIAVWSQMKINLGGIFFISTVPASSLRNLCSNFWNLHGIPALFVVTFH